MNLSSRPSCVWLLRQLLDGYLLPVYRSGTCRSILYLWASVFWTIWIEAQPARATNARSKQAERTFQDKSHVLLPGTVAFVLSAAAFWTMYKRPVPLFLYMLVVDASAHYLKHWSWWNRVGFSVLHGAKVTSRKAASVRFRSSCNEASLVHTSLWFQSPNPASKMGTSHHSRNRAVVSGTGETATSTLLCIQRSLSFFDTISCTCSYRLTHKNGCVTFPVSCGVVATIVLTMIVLCSYSWELLKTFRRRIRSFPKIPKHEISVGGCWSQARKIRKSETNRKWNKNPKSTET